MAHDNTDPLDEAAVQLAGLARALLGISEAGLRLRAAREVHRQHLSTPRIPAARVSDMEDVYYVTSAPAARHTDVDADKEAPAAPSGEQRHPEARERPVPDPVQRETANLRGPSESQLLAVHREAFHFFRQADRPRWALTLLTERSLEVCWEEPWGAGFAPAGWTQLTQHLRSRGWNDDVLVASGLSRRSRTGNLIDHFRDRVVLPLRSLDGDVVGFVGRRSPEADPRAPKYLNSPGSAVYDKSSLLFGLAEGHAALGSGATPVLVEGVLDAIAVCAAGGDLVGLAPCGTALSAAHVDSLGRVLDLAGASVVVATDNDSAGNAAAAKAFERLAGRCADARRGVLPEGLDPAALLARDGRDALRLAVTTGTRPLLDSAIDHRLQRWTDQLPWVQGRVRAARHIAPLIALLPERDRAGAVTDLARRLDLLESTVTDAVSSVGTSRGRQNPESPSMPSAKERPPPLRRMDTGAQSAGQRHGR